MFLKSVLAFSLCAVGMSGSAFAADTPSYSDVGNENPSWYKFVATETGPLRAYFVGSDTSLEERLVVIVNGEVVGPAFDGPTNLSLSRGQSINFGTVNAGDRVSFFLWMPSIFSGVHSDKLIFDGEYSPAFPNAVYSTRFSGDAALPAGTYVGFEDSIEASPSDFDYDYNDSEFVFTNITVLAD